MSTSGLAAATAVGRAHAEDSHARAPARPPAADSDDSLAPIEIHARRLERSAAHNAAAALPLLEALCATHGIPATSIHVIVQQHGLDERAAQRVLRAYYLLWNVQAARHCYHVSAGNALPALFAPGSARLTAMFGGQPGSSAYLAEARWLLDVYAPLVGDYVARMAAFLESLSLDPQLAPVYKKGLGVLRWLRSPASEPDAEYLVSAPVSMPLAGLVQLMHVAILHKTLGVSPGELVRFFNAAVGHSQGIAIAAAFSMVSDGESFELVSTKILGIMLLVGALPQIMHPSYICVEAAAGLPAPQDDTVPRPMVYVRGLAQPALKAVLAEFNEAQMSDSDHVHLAVTNSHDQFVVAGTILSAVQLVAVLRERSAQPDEDQSKVPFSRRRPVITASYVDITVPYHSALLEGAVDLIHTIALDKQWVLAAADMQIPVRACDDGHDIRSETDLTRYLIESICVLPVDWPQAVAVPGATHIVDFGTGGFGGFGQLAQKSVEGRGTAVICAGQLLPQTSQSNLGTRADLYQREMAQVISAPDWLAVFGPRLVRTAHDSKVHIDTRMTRTLGMGTVMVAGMEPTTGNMGLVAAIYNAGYHAEVGAGTIHSEEDMEDRLAELSSQIAPGQGITLNCIYINPRQWTFQYPVILRLRSEGVPITGLCIGGGVPTFAKALELIGELRATGIRHIAFKPSNPKAIRHVVRIAQAAEGFPVILQWTGGRAGGHHSYEDFHQPILETYAAIRACANVALVAGSGFGDAAGSLPYMTGEWSIRYGRAPMPFDGILLGSRIMVAKEAGTSLAAKELIVAAAGLPDSEWDKTYDGVHNGITVFESEYGELNHSLGTRAIAFIKDMRRIILSQPRDKQQAQLLAQKDEIIARLNSDYMRPWFGKKADGRVVDLEDMTYAEVVERMVELMYVKHQQRWIHKSYRQAIVEFVSRAERRMASASPDAPLAAELSQVDPLGYAARLIEEYPAATTQLLASEDVQFFIALCKRRGQKPFPFIPVLDGDFGVLMLKNTGWTSEDVDSLVDQDVQRVGIQQGPVAAQYSTIVNEPVKDILDGIYLGHIASLVERLHDGDESSIPTTDYIGGDPAVAVLPGAVRIEESEAERAFWMPSEEDQLPELDAWLLALAGLRKGWLHALVTAPHIAQGAKSVDNYVRRLLRPRAGRKVAVRLADGLPTSIVITGSAGAVEMEVHCSADRAIRLTIHHQTLHGIVVPLTLEFSYDPSQVLAPIHGSRQRDDDVVQQFAIGIWSASADEPEVYVDTVDPDEILRDELTITESHSRALCENTGNRLSQYAQAKDGRLAAPMEFLYVPTLRSILRVLQSSVFGSGQVNVVHLHNQLAFEDGVSGLHVGDTVAIAVRIDGIENLRSGKKLTLTTSMHVDGRKVGSMKSAFLSRSHFVDTAKTFERNCDQKITILLPSSADVAVLEMKEWFFYREDAPRRIEPGVEVEFALDSLCHFSREGVYSAIATTGTVSVRVRGGRSVHIADVDFGWGAATKNPVIEYLKRYRVDAETRLFENDGYSLTTAANAGLARAVVPATNWDYAKYSLDCNPFHLNPYIADFADLPEPITHGLWTGASTRAVVEAVAAVGHPERVRLYRTTFTGMVFPRAELNTELFHVGMKNGRMLVKGLTSQVGGGSVMELVAEVDQPKTAYIFTGQGAQEAGMGMRLYEQSAVARDIWDRANKHMLKTYDIDLLDIVRTNPKELTVYFHGKGGKRVRRSYMALSKRVPDKSSADGFRLAPIIPEITAQSRSHTFRSPTGLLNATQFTQTTLILVATAAVADMRAKGLVQSDAMFAGHSLGEYCALAALGDIFSLEGLLDITFYRGMIMQSAIPRDEQGRSEFGMVAVDPSRVAKGFGEDQLHLVADEICAASPGLLQIVNYNVRGHQYVAAGTLTNLSVLRLALDAIAATGIPIGSDDKTRISEAVSSVLAKPVGTEAVRGRATIPLHGIDVPFHSRQLVDGVPEFRDALRTKINCDSVSPDVLHRRYIPNLTAVPFEVSRAYFEMVYELTGSPVMRSALDVWSDTQLEDAAEMTRLSVDLLVELLTYQFAAPVQWIKTQDCLFGAAEVQRMVEIGPSPVLCGMAAKTLRGPAFARKQVSLLHFERDQDEIYYRHAREETVVATTVHTPAAPVELPKTEPMAAAQEPVATSPQPSSGAGAGEPIAEVPLQALDAVHAIVAFKVKQPLGGVSVQQNIKTLVAGKSTLQNEIIGDLQKEFGNKVPDKSEEVPLQELGTAIGTVDALGKCTQPLIARLFSSKMPGGFSLSSTRGILQSAYGLGPQRQDALLLVALTMEPAARLGSEADARSWLDGVAKAYASRAGISYASAAGAAAAGGQAQGPVVSSAEMDRMQKEQHEHARQQIAVLARYAGIDLRADGRSAEGERARASELQANVDGLNAELGEDFVEGIKPHFDARKARRFDSYWNWARQDAYEWIQQTVAGGGVVEDEARILQLQNCADEKLLKLLDGSVAVLNASEDPALAAAHRLATRLRDACKQALIGQPVYRELSAPMQPQTVISQTGSVSYSEVPRAGEPSLADYVEHMKNSNADSALPPLHMREKTEHGPWAYSPLLSEAYYRGLAELSGPGTSYAGATALVTGCGRGSIGAEIVRALLMGGARVVATTSSYSRSTTLFYEDMYRRHGARGSELVVVPFNQGSAQDVEALAGFVFGELGWSLDYVFPFAAVSDVGSLVTNIGSRSELAQRVILTNVLRLLGAIKAAKERTQRVTRPSLVVLPLSPNHGTIGGDGLYGECKIALETAFNRWASEGWEGHLSVAGAVIGWTRGTGLMSGNSLVAQEVEAMGVRTFSTREMAFNILGLLHPQVADIAHDEPIWADFGGGMERVSGLGDILKTVREAIDHKSSILRLMSRDKAMDYALTHPVLNDGATATPDMSPLAKYQHSFPVARDYDSLAHLHDLQGMVNLDKVVVVTGYGEVSPHGNAATRWEVEAYGELSVEGCIELAWIMGLIRHANGVLPGTGTQYTGWVDAKSGEPVRDADIKQRYEEYISTHTGIRLIEPELALGYDPAKKQVLREVQIEHDMEPFEAAAEDAAAYKKSNGDRVDVWENAGGASWSVRFLKGALIRVPAAVNATRLVAALLPTGWDAGRFGIPEDVIRQVDPVTLYVLVATVEALLRSGITDPYELYQHVHVSEVGSTVGSGLGGGQALQDMFWNRANDRETRNDTLQETFISTIQAWVNMLLMSSAGPVKPAVGACATTVLSIDTAVDTIQAGKAKVMLAGGVDDFYEEPSTEFAAMGATSNTLDEYAKGRVPSEMCRPCTSTRNGFMEGQGAGVVVLMSASTAIACGAPIYGIVGMSATATDKQGRSVPAPGKGVLGSAREVSNPAMLRQLSIKRRRGLMDEELEVLDESKRRKMGRLEQEAKEAVIDTEEAAALKAEIEWQYADQLRALQDRLGNEFWKRSTGISPLRGSLAVWGLDADDIGLASFHGTSTKANDRNESEVLDAQMQQLGRTPGHAVPAVCQKWLTGHSKGAAAAFMLNGVLQSLRTGIVPGNRNADNIDSDLRRCDYALYLSKTIQTAGIKAALLKSFGFGQVGGELLVVHPDYLLATLGRAQLEEYNAKLRERDARAHRYWQDALVGNHPFVQIKSSPPFTPEQERRVYLDSTARTHYDPRTGEYRF